MVLLMFAGWYLDTDSENPARLYIDFVLTTTNLLGNTCVLLCADRALRRRLIDTPDLLPKAIEL